MIIAIKEVFILLVGIFLGLEISWIIRAESED